MIKKIILTVVIIAVTIGAAYIFGVQAGNFFIDKKLDQHAKQREVYTQQILDFMGTIEKGYQMPDFKFITSDNQQRQLYDKFKSKTLMIIFDYTCENCIIEMEQVAAILQDHDYCDFLTLLSPSDPQYMEELRKDLNIPCEILHDHKYAFVDRIGVSSYPFNIVVDQTGVIDTILAGPLSKPDLETLLKRISSQ